MKEDLIRESNPRMLLFSAVAAVFVHALVFFCWTKISLEQNAYAIGNRGSVEMILSSVPIEEMHSEQTSPQVVEPIEQPEPVKVPTEFKKKVIVKPVKKEVVRQQAAPPVETIKNEQPPVSNLDSARKVSGDVQGEVAKGGSVAEPDYLNNPPPKYPNESRRRHEEGVVLIFASIDSSGRVESLDISKSSGFSLLDEAAVSAVKNWKFKPARFAGISIDSNVEIPVRFSLR